MAFLESLQFTRLLSQRGPPIDALIFFMFGLLSVHSVYEKDWDFLFIETARQQSWEWHWLNDWYMEVYRFIPKRSEKNELKTWWWYKIYAEVLHKVEPCIYEWSWQSDPFCLPDKTRSCISCKNCGDTAEIEERHGGCLRILLCNVKPWLVMKIWDIAAHV